MDPAKEPLFKEEYLLLQRFYQEFDGRALTIKGWIGASTIVGISTASSLTGGSGAYLAAYRLVVYLSLIAISITFWILETYWKLFQRGFSDRMHSLESMFRGDEAALRQNPAPFQVSLSWRQSYEAAGFWGRLLKEAGRSFVHLPYSVIIVILCILLVYPAN